MKEVKIKKANLDDANRILEIQKKAFQVKGKIYDDFSLPALEETLEELKEEFKQKTIFKIVSATGEILGSGRTYIEDGTCYISRLSVTPKYQNEGLGTRLMKFIEDYHQECENFQLCTGDKSKKSLSLYRKLGYEIFKSEPYNESFDLVYLRK